jgi:hypothetical protein
LRRRWCGLLRGYSADKRLRSGRRDVSVITNRDWIRDIQLNLIASGWIFLNLIVPQSNDFEMGGF